MLFPALVTVTPSAPGLRCLVERPPSSGCPGAALRAVVAALPPAAARPGFRAVEHASSDRHSGPVERSGWPRSGHAGRDLPGAGGSARVRVEPPASEPGPEPRTRFGVDARTVYDARSAQVLHRGGVAAALWFFVAFFARMRVDSRLWPAGVACAFFAACRLDNRRLCRRWALELVTTD